MKSGDLRHRVKFYTPVRTPDGNGGFTQELSLVCEVWSRIKTGATTYGAGKELVKAAKLEPIKVFLIELRYREDLDEQMIAVWRGHRLELTAILFPDANRERMQVLAREIGLNVKC